jgi:hypothetical protein
MKYATNFKQHLLYQRNVYSATAIGLALSKWGYQPPQRAASLRVWDIIKPMDNFAGARNFMAKNKPCLPLLLPFIVELRQSGNASAKIVEAFQFLAYFGEDEEEIEQHVKEVVGNEAVEEGMGESWYRFFWESVSYNCCI